ncbi:hypothetical protein Pelo_3563 [Pelomyxa schiedti]|nr:hypothetical protein Pelo_3563 [Pelomyxa schiedti]
MHNDDSSTDLTLCNQQQPSLLSEQTFPMVPPSTTALAIDPGRVDDDAVPATVAVTIVDLPDSVLVAIAAYVAADATPITASDGAIITAPGLVGGGGGGDATGATTTSSSSTAEETTPCTKEEAAVVPSGITLSMTNLFIEPEENRVPFTVIVKFLFGCCTAITSTTGVQVTDDQVNDCITQWLSALIPSIHLASSH